VSGSSVPDAASLSREVGASESVHREFRDADRTIRVLMVMHTPASLQLGAARVQLELAEVLRAHGCEVRVLDRGEILGDLGRRHLGVSPDAFSRAAVRHVRAIAHEYDVIDAHQGNLPVSKRSLGFTGLMVTRSVGLAHFYDAFLRDAQRRWPTTKSRLLTRPVRRWRRRRSLRQVTATFKLSDLIIVPNKDEQAYLTAHLHVGEKIALLPLGISAQQLDGLRRMADDEPRARVAFIGDWSARKGSHDWPDIVARVRRRVPHVSFAFLGTHAEPAEVSRVLGVDPGVVDVIPSYEPQELDRLLDGVRVGALPSYIEGLGIGVLEKLAAGIPSVCYDVPGPRETVGRVDPSLLVAVGDTEAFAERVIELLEMGDDDYRRLSERCRRVAEEFSWRLIGQATLSVYQERLAMLEDGSLRGR
jgi:glycosyltransferase involved in cell wall biosynthesis